MHARLLGAILVLGITALHHAPSTVAAASAVEQVASGSLAAEDRRAILAQVASYRDGWLANDSERVMSTLTPDAVLFPSGMRPIAGEVAIRQFWFATGGPATTVTSMEQNVLDVAGDGELAIVTGIGSLAFHTGDPAQTRTQESWFINVLARQTDGRWLIAKRMWSNLSR